MQLLFDISRRTQNYQVQIDTYNEKNKKNTLRYTMLIHQEKESWSGKVIRFNRTEIQLNDPKDLDPINEILLIAGEVQNDLLLEISDYGKVLKVKNDKDMQLKWNEIRYRIQETYQGQIVQKIIAPMENNIKNQDVFIQSLDKDPFFFNFLKGIYGDYSGNIVEFEGIIPAAFGYGNLPVVKKNRLYSDDLTSEKKISSTISITQEDITRFKQLITPDVNEILDIEMKAEYRFMNKFIQKITVNQNLFLDKLPKRGVTLTVNLIN